MKKYSTILATSLILGSAICSKVAVAETYDDRWYVAPTLTYLWLDDDRLSSRNGFGGAVGIGKAINQEFNFEGKILYQNYRKGSDSQDRWNVSGVAFDAQYYLSRGEIAPYLVAGIGAMNSNLNNENTLGAFGEAGVGVSYKLHGDVSLRSDVRYRHNKNSNSNMVANSSDEYNDMVVNFGLVIPFGGKSQPRKEPVKNYTYEDLDSDQDGVKDSVDECPNTKRGAKVNKIGCEFVLLSEVNFSVNSAKLTPSAEAFLDRLAVNLKNSPHQTMEIHGHTSTEGSDKANMILSKKRALAVVVYLKNHGVENKITARGFGESSPIADESMPGGREENRRVELIRK